MVCTGGGPRGQGYIANGRSMPPARQGKLDVAGLVGKKGKLTVVRDMSCAGRTWARKPRLREIAEDLPTITRFVPAAVALYLGVWLDAAAAACCRRAGCAAAAALSDGVIESMQSRAEQIGELSKRLADGAGLEDAAKAALALTCGSPARLPLSW